MRLALLCLAFMGCGPPDAHIASREPQPCVRCHANMTDGCSTDFAVETDGFGTGRHMMTNEAGTT